MSTPEGTQQEAAPRANSWWQRKRLPLLALVPLAALAVGATSYQYRTLYLPNELTRPQQASGPTLKYRDTLLSGGQRYARAVTITLKDITPRPAEVSGLTAWDVRLELQAAPDVPLRWCQISLLDTQGRRYDTGVMGVSREASVRERLNLCVPEDAPGPTFDITGKLEPGHGAARPARWDVTETVVLPAAQSPAFVQLSWKSPHYALIPVPGS